MSKAVYDVALTADADRDFLEIMDWSVANFGERAADRYETLIAQALIDLCEDPFRPGAKARPELLAGLYSYHLVASRDRVTGQKVMTPRHFLVYQVNGSQVAVLRVLHDSRDLGRHVAAVLQDE